ncbi:hypothetical protein MXD63_11835 [Frankia sp. Cpl3]|uniref:hypothetical protein n=1 Tax=Parafrankia colletiae TaxID=573497 RepID=UPI0012FF9B8E|nr:hypothetical protein [Parafrankia colletiae]MCK9900768.1 hypothetical protein [Frankia sp. Cpl3]
MTADSLAAILDRFSRDAYSPLRTISDTAYEAGLARLRAAAETEHGPVVDTMDLLVFD